MKTFQVLVSVLVFFLNIACCAENKQFNLNDVQIKMNIDGKEVYTINLEALDYFLVKIEPHAANYPPTFKDQKEKDLIMFQLKTLVGMQKKAFTNMKDDLNFLGRYGYSLAMAYNLDMLDTVGNASEVVSVFEKALAIDQDNPVINYSYGGFLYQAGLSDKAIPHLKKAIDGGIKQAKWGLALIYSSNKATQSKAIELFKEYIQDFPNTQSAEQAKKAVEILKAPGGGATQYTSNNIAASNITEIASRSIYEKEISPEDKKVLNKDGWQENHLKNAKDVGQLLGDGNKITFSLPVNGVGNKKIHLMVKIPTNFKYVQHGTDSAIHEFIPMEDKNPSAWSEIITVQLFIGKQVPAKKFIKLLLNSIEHHGNNAKVLDERYVTHEKYDEGNALVVYTNQGRRELLKIYMASGPYDSVMVQDAMLIKSDNEIKSAFQRLNNFFKNNLSVMFFGVSNSTQLDPVIESVFY